MISFRYHLVSIIAVFLALALGIVVGATALNGPITKDLRQQVNDAKKQRDTLAAQNKLLGTQVDDANQFASTYGARLVSGTLTGNDILEIVLPGTPSTMVDGITSQLTAAGGKVTGQVSITDAYLDPSRGTGITSLATGPVRPLAWTAPQTSDSGRLGGSLLAFVLLGKGQSTDLQQVLGGFSELHMISLGGNDVTPAKNVVVIGHGVPSGSYATSVELSLVGALADGGHVVVAGDAGSATGGGVIAAARGSQGVRAALSSVDNADTAFGQVSTALALAAAAKGEEGHYGTGQGADALYPAPPK